MKNWHCSQRRKLCGWFKYHDDFCIVTSLYPYFIFKSCFCYWFPQIPVHISNEYTRTDTLNSDPILFFDETCHKTQSQTNRQTSINRNIRHGQPLSPYIRLLSTCALTLSIREAVGPLPLLLGRACPLLRARARHQYLSWSTVHVGSTHNLNWGADEGRGV